MIEEYLATLRTNKSIKQQTQTLLALQKYTKKSKTNTSKLLKAILHDSSLISLLLLNCSQVEIQMDILAFFYKLLPPAIVNAHCLFNGSTDYYLRINNSNYYNCSKMFLVHFNNQNNCILCCLVNKFIIEEVVPNNKLIDTKTNNRSNKNDSNYNVKNINVVDCNKDSLNKSTMFIDEEGLKVFIEKKNYKIKYTSIKGYKIENVNVIINVLKEKIITISIDNIDILNKIDCYLKLNCGLKTPKSNKKNSGSKKAINLEKNKTKCFLIDKVKKLKDNNKEELDKINSIEEYCAVSSTKDKFLGECNAKTEIKKIYSPYKDLCLDYEKMKSINLGPVIVTINKESEMIEESLKSNHINDIFIKSNLSQSSNEKQIELYNNSKNNDSLESKQKYFDDLSSENKLLDFKRKKINCNYKNDSLENSNEISKCSKKSSSKTSNDSLYKDSYVSIDKNKTVDPNKDSCFSSDKSIASISIIKDQPIADSFNKNSIISINNDNNKTVDSDVFNESNLGYKNNNIMSTVTTYNYLDNKDIEKINLTLKSNGYSTSKNTPIEIKKRKKRKSICINRKDKKVKKLNIYVEELINLKKELFNKIGDKIIAMEEKRIKILLNQIKTLK